MSTEHDFTFHLGEDWIVDFTLEDGDGDAVNISGSPTIRFRVSTIAGTTVMTLTESDGILVTGGSAGECTLTVTPTHQTSAGIAAATRYQWELRAVAGGITTVQGRGHINVLPSLLA